ncbi:uncharacterized protein isoform X4 [Castor canadensis]|jgi:hypothetical protein|uniref:Uncharacterized protein isoform X4 n=1 Tax=Castor canadensis TaxID=51338 RepID=A0AC58LYN6_CASCN
MSGKRSLRPLSATHPDPGSPGRGRPGNGPSRPCWPAGQRSAHTGGQKGRRGGFTVRGSGAGERGVRLRRPEPGSAAAAVVASFIFAAAAATCQRERRKRPRQRRQESLAGFGQNSRAARSPRPAFRSRAGGARVSGSEGEGTRRRGSGDTPPLRSLHLRALAESGVPAGTALCR